MPVQTRACGRQNQKLQFLDGFTKIISQPGSPLANSRIIRGRLLPALLQNLTHVNLRGHVLKNVRVCLQKLNEEQKANTGDRSADA